MKGICGFYIELCVVIFVFLPGSEHVKVRQYKGVVFSFFACEKLSAKLNLSTMILKHNYFSKNILHWINPDTECGKRDHCVIALV